MSGGGKPGCAFGPHGGGENQSVSAGPSPLHETRTKNRRSTTDWKPRIDLTRIGMEHASCEVLPLIFHLVLCTILVLADSLHRIDHPRCVSAKNACIFYRTLTLAVAAAGSGSDVGADAGGSWLAALRWATIPGHDATAASNSRTSRTHSSWRYCCISMARLAWSLSAISRRRASLGPLMHVLISLVAFQMYRQEHSAGFKGTHVMAHVRVQNQDSPRRQLVVAFVRLNRQPPFQNVHRH